MLPVDFIYSEYASTLGHVGNNYRKMVWQIAEDYACANVLLRLPGYSPMPAFGEVIDVPLVVRHAQKSKAQVSFHSTASYQFASNTWASLHMCALLTQ